MRRILRQEKLKSRVVKFLGRRYWQPNSEITNAKPLFNLKSTEIKVTANIQVTNASSVEKYPSFSIAVFNEEGSLVGVASGGTWIKGVNPKETTSFTLDFEPMKERVPLGTLFHLSTELK